MPNISIQFHATPAELRCLIQEAIGEFKLSVAAMTFWPYRVSVVGAEEIGRLLSGSKAVSLYFTLATALLKGKDQLEFKDANPDALFLRVGRYENGELHESWLTTKSNDPKAFDVWQDVARKLKKIASTGTVAINPDDGASAPARDHRFTAQAKLLDQQGIIMRPVAGRAILHFTKSPRGGQKASGWASTIQRVADRRQAFKVLRLIYQRVSRAMEHTVPFAGRGRDQQS